MGAVVCQDRDPALRAPFLQSPNFLYIRSTQMNHNFLCRNRAHWYDSLKQAKATRFFEPLSRIGWCCDGAAVSCLAWLWKRVLIETLLSLHCCRRDVSRCLGKVTSV